MIHKCWRCRRTLEGTLAENERIEQIGKLLTDIIMALRTLSD